MKSNKTTINSEQIIDQLRVENELKNKWISLIAHNCRGLDSNIKYLLDAMTQESITPEIFMSMLPELKQIAESNSKTIQSTFAWVNAQADGLSIDNEAVLIHNLFLDLMREFDKEIGTKELSLIFVGDQKTLLNTDRFLLRFILKQLIENAIKYSNKGGVIEVVVHSDTDKVNIAIKDNGVGMVGSRLNTIGTLDGSPYTGTMNEKGAGLSLVIVKDFVRMLKGRINISSVEEVGTSVELEFSKEG